MWDYVSKTIRWALHATHGLDRSQWFLVLLGVLLLGFFCLRGFGSRSNY